MSSAKEVALSHAFTLESPEELVKLLMPRLYPRTIRISAGAIQYFLKLRGDSNVQKRLGTTLQILALNHDVTVKDGEHSTPSSPGTD